MRNNESQTVAPARPSGVSRQEASAIPEANNGLQNWDRELVSKLDKPCRKGLSNSLKPDKHRVKAHFYKMGHGSKKHLTKPNKQIVNVSFWLLLFFILW